MTTLQDRFDPRRNAFDVLRLALALLVAVGHGISSHLGSQHRWGDTSIAGFALDGFFILSGFLVTRSRFRLESFPRFAWHRLLRVMPGFWVCLAVMAFVAAPLAAALQGMSPFTAFTGAPSAWDYLLGNAGLLIVQYDISGILATVPKENSFNGALWTLVFEAFCYALVGVLGALGLLRRRPVLVPLAAGGLIVLTALQEAGYPALVNERIVRLVLMFLLGATAYLYAHRIPMRTDLAVASVGVFLLSVALFQDYRVLGAVPLAYLVIAFAACCPWTWTMRTDLSYGIYVYHWPVLQLGMLTALRELPTALYVAVGIVLTLPLATASWYLVEKRALAHKDSAVPVRIAERVAGAFARPTVGAGR